MTFPYKARLVAFGERFGGAINDRPYMLPLFLGLFSAFIFVFMLVLSVQSITRLNNTVYSLPAVIHAEMTNTRRLLKEEQRASRDLTVEAHLATRAHTDQQHADDRVVLRKEIDRLRRELDACLAVPVPVRKRVLGIF